MCPEMLTPVLGHGLPLDLYSLGALLHELLLAHPPHLQSPYEQPPKDILYTRIMHGKILEKKRLSRLSEEA
jgi:hypothetical protein